MAGDKATHCVCTVHATSTTQILRDRRRYTTVWILISAAQDGSDVRGSDEKPSKKIILTVTETINILQHMP